MRVKKTTTSDEWKTLTIRFALKSLITNFANELSNPLLPVDANRYRLVMVAEQASKGSIWVRASHTVAWAARERTYPKDPSYGDQ